jgi:predicted ATPase
MRLLRVQVPEFRALKDVDISFEPEFSPQVFPLGSLNGGGKSTLLQLIFVLLSCLSSRINKKQYLDRYLDNIIYSIGNYDNIEKAINFATITILTSKNKKICLKYYYGNGELFMKILSEQENRNYTTEYCPEKKYLIIINSIEGFNHEDLLSEIRENIFLISPSNQSYLFLTREQRRLLFTTDPEKTYEQVLKGLKTDLPNFFTYDFIDGLTEIFHLATVNDARERAETGVYGTNVEQLENTINNLFIDGKKIIPIIPQQKRFTQNIINSVSFKLPSGEEIYPEDLSHGELKRLAIFVLLKYHDMQDAIVLMDEVENGFHPDWQRHIIDDLVEWGGSNQYILATHSYELCRGVTPAHVKELEPKLL